MWPPIRNFLELHVLHANQQAKIWLQADQEEMHVSSPISTLAWGKECDYLRAIWTKLLPFSAGCLQLVTCGCESESKTARCTRFLKSFNAFLLAGVMPSTVQIQLEISFNFVLITISFMNQKTVEQGCSWQSIFPHSFVEWPHYHDLSFKRERINVLSTRINISHNFFSQKINNLVCKHIVDYFSNKTEFCSIGFSSSKYLLNDSRHYSLQFKAAILEIFRSELFERFFCTYIGIVIILLTRNTNIFCRIWLNGSTVSYTKYFHATIIYYNWPPSWKLYIFKVSEVFHSLLNHRQYIKFLEFIQFQSIYME